MNVTKDQLAQAIATMKQAYQSESFKQLMDLVKNNPELNAFVDADSIKTVTEVVQTAPTVEAVTPERKPRVELNNAPSGQHRRIKKQVNKLPVKERELLPEERDQIIQYMNKTQALMPHDSGEGDGICQQMCDKFNAESPRLNRVWPYQVSGYYSHLCRMAMKPKDNRDDWFVRAVAKGSLTGNVRPYFGVNLQRRVASNWSKARREEWERKQDHAQMLSERMEKGVL